MIKNPPLKMAICSRSLKISISIKSKDLSESEHARSILDLTLNV